MPKVIEIVKEHLKANGFGGLVNSTIQCGCEIDDLAPCGECHASQCEAGYKHFDPRGGNPQAWAIWTTKEPPEDSDWENMGI